LRAGSTWLTAGLDNLTLSALVNLRDVPQQISPARVQVINEIQRSINWLSRA